MLTEDSYSTGEHPFQKVLNCKGNKISLEVCPRKDLSFDLLSELKPAFCSVTWGIKSEQDYLEDIENCEPLILAGEIYTKGYEVVLHLPGNHFSKDQVLTILNRARSFGVRGILVIQGG